MTAAKTTTHQTQEAIAERLGWTNLQDFPKEMYGHAPGVNMRSLVPDWPHDLNAALSLPLPVGAQLSIAIRENYITVDLTGEMNRTANCKIVADLAAAICACWLRSESEK